MFNKMIFADMSSMKLTFDGQKACERLGVNPSDLIEKTPQEIKKEVRNEYQILTEEVV